jgi:hypothetical protein
VFPVMHEHTYRVLQINIHLHHKITKPPGEKITSNSIFIPPRLATVSKPIEVL